MPVQPSQSYYGQIAALDLSQIYLPLRKVNFRPLHFSNFIGRHRVITELELLMVAVSAFSESIRQ